MRQYRYCIDCKWLYSQSITEEDGKELVGIVDNRCNCPMNIGYKDTPLRKVKMMPSIEFANRNNDCRHFEPTMLFRIKQFFKKINQYVRT